MRNTPTGRTWSPFCEELPSSQPVVVLSSSILRRQPLYTDDCNAFVLCKHHVTVTYIRAGSRRSMIVRGIVQRRPQAIFIGSTTHLCLQTLSSVNRLRTHTHVTVIHLLLSTSAAVILLSTSTCSMYSIRARAAADT